ncbi:MULTISPECIES: DUF6262 family protein [Lysinibacillus]|uniref:DUF6262 family protein n=1 Tax=Lysinibacillus TaxID=400634 RepID=UPI00214BADDF|nr:MULTISPECIES: DUF6262 family protein [Lysinibacillus]UUV24522.1 DUF6262 family protein [Lysinibacillus sp. FN11]UYB47395.1 DUF6262 family protein [Lysinibacillus capsici]
MMNNKDLAEINREKTTVKVVEAIQKLKRKKMKITISSVANEANVTRQTLYNRPDLKLKIDEANSLMNDKKRTKEVDNKNSVQEKRIKRLQEELKQSNEEKLKLLDQNVFLTEEIINLQRRIADLEEKVYKDSVIKLVQR